MKNWLINSWKMLSAIVGCVVVLSTAVGGMAVVDDRYAKADYVSAIEDRLDIKIIQDQIDAIQERMWKIEDRWNERFKKEHDRYPETTDELKAYMDKDTRETYRDLEDRLSELEAELKSIREKNKKAS